MPSRDGVLIWEMAAAKAWLPGGMGGISIRGQSGGQSVERCPVSKAGCAFE